MAKNEYQYLYKKNEEITNDPEGIDIVYGEVFYFVKLFTPNYKYLLVYEDVELCDIVNLIHIKEYYKRIFAFFKQIGFG